MRLLIVILCLLFGEIYGRMCIQHYYCTCYRKAKYRTNCGLFSWSWARCTTYRSETYGCLCSRNICCTGFTGDYCNTDINECSTDAHGCQHNCVNTHGSYHCTCRSGYTLDLNLKSCLDMNECSSYNGGCGQLCNNNQGSYSCNCRSGYKLNSDGITCSDMNECSSNNGGCGQLCNNNQGSYSCNCTSGYKLNSDGKTCSADNTDDGLKPMRYFENIGIPIIMITQAAVILSMCLYLGIKQGYIRPGTYTRFLFRHVPKSYGNHIGTIT